MQQQNVFEIFVIYGNKFEYGTTMTSRYELKSLNLKKELNSPRHVFVLIRV
jgi:hypothetical protein